MNLRPARRFSGNVLSRDEFDLDPRAFNTSLETVFPHPPKPVVPERAGRGGRGRLEPAHSLNVLIHQDWVPIWINHHEMRWAGRGFVRLN
jgi:hypothetical protein